MAMASSAVVSVPVTPFSYLNTEWSLCIRPTALDRSSQAQSGVEARNPSTAGPGTVLRVWWRNTMASSPLALSSGTGSGGSAAGTSAVPCTETEKELWRPWTVPSRTMLP